MHRTVRLTKAVIERAELPETGYYLLRDSGQRGLAVRITAGGSKRFVFDGRLAGRMKRITLDVANVEQARREVQKRRGSNLAPQTTRGGPTLQQLFDAYLERHARPQKKSWADDVELWNSTLRPAWRSLKAASLTSAMVSGWHHELSVQRGPYRANRALALIRCVFNRGKDWQLVSGDNPCARIKMNPEVSRERFLSPDEVRRLNDALADEPDWRWRAFFPLSLYTGARKTELLSARWEHIDLERRTLTLPAAKTKGGRTVVLPLSQPAIEILTAMPSRENSPWLFPGVGASGHVESPKIVWKKLIKRAGLVDVRPHDLRRTVGSWLAGEGYSLPIIGRALGHRSLSATAVYARLDTSVVRAALDVHGALIAAAVNHAPGERQ